MIEFRGLQPALGRGDLRGRRARSGVATLIGRRRGRARCRFSDDVFNTVVIMAAMPTAMMSLVIGTRSGLRSDVLAGAVVVTTLLATLTLPRVAGDPPVSGVAGSGLGGGRRPRAASQVVLGLDPDPAARAGRRRGRPRLLPPGDRRGRARPASRPRSSSRPSSASAPPGWEAFERVAAAAAEAGLLVIADAKRGDVDVTSRAYADGLPARADRRAHHQPLARRRRGGPLHRGGRARRAAGCSPWCAPPTPAPPSCQDLPLASGGLWHEEVARRVAEWGAPERRRLGPLGPRRRGRRHRARADGRPARADAAPALPDPRRRAPRAGRAEDLGPAFGGRAAGALVAASRSIIFAESPRRAAEELRETLWGAYEAAG